MFLQDTEFYTGSRQAVINEITASLPSQWQAYVNSSMQVRLEYLRSEMQVLALVMPRSTKRLLELSREVFVVKASPNLTADSTAQFIRVINKEIQDDGELYSYFSKSEIVPASASDKVWHFSRHAPEMLSSIYKYHFNGLFDASLTGGPLALSEMTPLSQTLDDFAEFPWFNKLAKLEQPENIWLIFSSGGGGYLYLDLRVNQKDILDPKCILVTLDADEEPEFSVGLWEYLDMWTLISLGE